MDRSDFFTRFQARLPLLASLCPCSTADKQLWLTRSESQTLLLRQTKAPQFSDPPTNCVPVNRASFCLQMFPCIIICLMALYRCMQIAACLAFRLPITPPFLSFTTSEPARGNGRSAM